MGCYKNIIDSLRLCGNGDDPVDECGQVDCVCHYGERDSMCRQKVMFDAADAIEELLAAVRSVVRCKDCEWWTKQEAQFKEDVLGLLSIRQENSIARRVQRESRRRGWSDGKNDV